MNGGRAPDATAAVDAMLSRGIERYRGGDVKEAASLWREAVQTAPGDERARAYLAWAESRLMVEDPSSVALPEDAGGTGTAEAGWLDDSLGGDLAGEDLDEAGTGSWSRSSEAGDTVAEAGVVEARPVDGDDWKREITNPWHPARDAAIDPAPEPYRGAEAPVRRFLARTPTQPNLPPLDVPVLNEEQMAKLADGSGKEQDAAPGPTPESRRRAALAQSSLRGEVAERGARIQADADASLAADQTQPMAFEAMSAPGAGAGEDWSRLADEPFPEAEPDAAAALLSALSLADDEAVSLPPPAAPAPIVRSIDEILDGARRALARGDVSGAVAIAEHAVERAGGLSAPGVAAHRGWLHPLYERLLGDGSRTVRLGSLPPSLDARSAFLLSRVDGTFSIDDLLDISGMDRADAVRQVALLIHNGALRAD